MDRRTNRSDAPPVEGRSRLRRPAGPDTASYVAALSGLIEELSREIAAAFPVDRP